MQDAAAFTMAFRTVDPPQSQSTAARILTPADLNRYHQQFFQTRKGARCMADNPGFNRHPSPESVPQPTSTITTAKEVHPLSPTATITKAWPAKSPLPSLLPTGPTKGERE
jgi:hypothetical protein